ncbi:MAG: branched-chain amino acid transporter substrate-binding protein [Nocardioidaceae bacterium]|nr:branched-chain amino acid transporter substrate-binding protein [Nocardioidaceae bacterium]
MTTTATTADRTSKLLSMSLLRPLIWVGITVLFVLAPKLGVSASDIRTLTLIALLALVVSGLNLSFGYAGELSFAQPAMYAIGAYVTATLALNWVNDILLLLIISAAAGFALGLISGIPGLRLGGWMLAITSLYILLLVPDVVSALKKWTGGFQGLSGIPLPKLFGHELTTNGYFVMLVIVTSVWFALFRNLIMSRTGNTLSVLRQSPVLASSLGISVYGTKLKAYAIAGIPAALAGTFFAFLDGFIAPEQFGIQYGIITLAAAILGGARSVYGVFIGATLMQLGPLQTGFFGDYAFIAYGVFLLVAGVALQRGIAGVFNDAVARVKARRKPEESLEVDLPSDVAFPPMHAEKLDISGVSKHFGGISALSNVTFAVEPGEVVALIGPNGSGKTTLLNIVSGYYKSNQGSVTIGDRDITGMATHKISRAGIARTFQTPNIPAMSVRQVVESARTNVTKVSVIETMLRLPRYHKVVKADKEVVDSLLAAVGLTKVADENAQALPLGTRRLLELARSLAAEPAVLLLDEVASGLDDEEIKELSRIIRAVRDSGGSVLLVEHNFSLVRALADRVVVLSRGEVVVVETPEAAARHPEVLEHYLGQPASTVAPATDGASS